MFNRLLEPVPPASNSMDPCWPAGPKGVSGLAQDLGEVIKRNPIPAVLIAVGVRFVVARLARG